jgi:tail lysozyme/hemopexin
MSEVYFVKADQCVRFDMESEVVDGAASAIGQIWSGLAEEGFGDGIDAAVNYGNGKAYFFKGDSYVRVDIESAQVEDGSSLIVDSWSGMGDAGFGEGVDAAVNYGDGRVYFFKGDKYVAYSIDGDAVDGAVGSLVGWALPQGFESDLDAVVNYGDGKLYFFKGTQYARFDVASVSGEYSAAIVDYWKGTGDAGLGEGLRGSWCTAPPKATPPLVLKPEPVRWEASPLNDRMAYAMKRLVEEYGYPVNGAAGLVGNLVAESGVIPSRVEGSAEATPLRSRDFKGGTTDFSAADVMNRNGTTGVGPALPGVGLAQWTTAERRNGLFSYSYDGATPGADVLFDMDAQLDYLAHELGAKFAGVDGVLRGASVGRADACDEVVYSFEVPGAILEEGNRLPRTDPRVQAVFEARRPAAEQAFNAYQSANPGK